MSPRGKGSARTTGLWGRARRRIERALPPRARIRVVSRLVRRRRRLRAGTAPAVVDVGPDTVVVMALGVDEAELERCAAATAAALRAGSATPLLLTDCDAFGVVRPLGIPFEYVPPRATFGAWMSTDYEEFVDGRTRELLEAYGARGPVEWTGDPEALEAMLRLPPDDG